MHLATWMVVVMAVISAGCGEKKDPSREPVVPAEFAKKHKAAVDAFTAKLDTAANLIKDAPATSVKHADPEVPVVLIRSTYTEGENAFIFMGHDLRTLPEFGKYDGTDMMKGQDGITVVYSDFLDLQSAWAMAEGKPPRFEKTNGAADYLVRRMNQMRFVIIARETAYTPGTINKTAKTFSPGTFEGVAHLVDLAAANGPKHLGSVAFKATNTGSFESYEGSEDFMLSADLNKATVQAFIAEMNKVFPSIQMPELAK